MECDRRISSSPRSQQIERTGTPRVHRIGEDISRCGLNKKRRMTDERDDGCGTVQRGRLRERFVEMRRPRCSPLEEQFRKRREWLSGGAGGVDEPRAVKVIALLPSHVRSSPRPTRLMN